MCGDAISAPWQSPGFGAGKSGSTTMPQRGRTGSAKHLRLGLGSALALLFLAFVPAHYGPPPPAASDSGHGVAAASTARTYESNDYLVGAVRADVMAMQVPERDESLELRAAGDVQAAPSPDNTSAQTSVETSGDGAGDGSGQSGVVADSTIAPQPAQSDRPANTAQPKALTGPAIMAAATPGHAPEPLATPQVYKKDLYDGGLVRYQDPDMTACTATATQMMLNFTASRGSPGAGFVWAPTTSYDTQEGILAWERENDTLISTAPGSDPHGWRNALNYYGWNDYRSPGSHHYEDLAYSSYATAVKAAVVAIAVENQPVGILGWSGGHAQIMTGYEVYGADPAVSSDFVVQAVYLTDPLASNRMRDTRITYLAFGAGSTTYRFLPYNWTDSPADDPYMPGSTASYLEWYGKWVIVAPVSMSAAVPAGPAVPAS